MRIRIPEQFRHAREDGSTAWYAPGDYTVKPEAGDGEFAITKEAAEVALATDAASDITGEGRAPKE